MSWDKRNWDTCVDPEGFLYHKQKAQTRDMVSPTPIIAVQHVLQKITKQNEILNYNNNEFFETIFC